MTDTFLGNTSTDIDSLELGFAEEDDSYHLMSHLFPNKIGGRPAWLALDHLPQSEQLQCTICQKPMSFLMQIYSPVDAIDDCFHRTIFIFMCLNGSCFSTKDDARPFAAFRSQMARKNKYYSFEPPSNYFPKRSQVEKQVKDGLVPHASKFATLCSICGCPGSKTCAQCKVVNYCSKEHQTVHWRSGHKAQCPQFLSGSLSVPSSILAFDSNPALLPELKITIGPDPHGSPSSSPDPSPSRQSRTKDRGDEKTPAWDLSPDRDMDLQKKMAAMSTQESNDIDDLEEAAKTETEGDKLFARFKKAIKDEPDQIIRYHRKGHPLWLAPMPKDSSDIPVDDISAKKSDRLTQFYLSRVPPCPSCGAPRQFECQVMPQLLTHLGLDKAPGEAAVDWGSLYLFVCSAQCNPPEDGTQGEYLPEVILRQDVQ